MFPQSQLRLLLENYNRLLFEIESTVTNDIDQKLQCGGAPQNVIASLFKTSVRFCDHLSVIE